jgi:hypothetical protein
MMTTFSPAFQPALRVLAAAICLTLFLPAILIVTLVLCFGSMACSPVASRSGARGRQ